MSRQDDIARFYDLLGNLERLVSGKEKLKNCTGYMDWPNRGVYFFLEPGETRDSTDQMRVTRAGTHAVSEGSSTSLWDRLKQHYGTASGSSDHPHGGNHLAVARKSRRLRRGGIAFVQATPALQWPLGVQRLRAL